MSQEEHNDVGEPQTNPSLYAVEVRAPTVAWTPVDNRGGITFTTTANPKLVIHTTETKGLPLYPFPPHVTVDLAKPEKIWQHVTGTKGAYALKSAPQSPQLRGGPGLAGGAHLLRPGDARLDRPPVPVTRPGGRSGSTATRACPSASPPVLGDGEAYGGWRGRMSPAEFKAFTGVCGHQHVNDNDHWDPGGLRHDRTGGRNRPSGWEPPTRRRRRRR